MPRFIRTTAFLLCFVPAMAALAADPATRFNSTVRQGDFTTPAERQMEFIELRHDAPTISLGRTDYVMTGPLVAGFRKLPPPEEHLSLGRKVLRLPVIRLLVPGPMENPPGGTGKYFAWRNENCDLPWPVAASRPVAAHGATTRVEPDSALVQLRK